MAARGYDHRQVGVECANGCRTRETRSPVRCTGSRRICDACYERLGGWLRDVPALLATLESLVAAGSLQGEQGGKPTKKAHSPIPIRTDVVALLDERGDESISLLLNRWAGWVAACRGLSSRPTWNLERHLGWLACTDQARAFYEQVRAMHWRAERAAGWAPPTAVGVCGAEVDGEVCGGPLLPLQYSIGVECKWCGDCWHEGDLRGLGRVLSRRWVPVQVAAYVSARPEATVRDWVSDLALPSVCDLKTRQILVDATALAGLATKRARRRRRGSVLASEIVT